MSLGGGGGFSDSDVGSFVKQLEDMDVNGRFRQRI